MPVYKRNDKRRKPYYYKFDLNRQTYKEGGFATPREAADAEAAKRLQVKTSQTPTAFSTAITMRLNYVKVYCRPSHYRANVTRLRRFADWRDLDLSEITPERIRTRLVDLSQTLSHAETNKTLIALRSVLEQAVNDGHLGRNPCRGLKFLPVERRVKYVPPTADIEAVLALAQPIDRAYLIIIWQLGARVREVNNLTWEDVDFNRRLVRLWTRKKRGGHKTPRLVEMNQRAFDALKLAQWQRLPGNPYVFPNPKTGKPYDYRDKFFDRLCRLAGVPEMGYHALRHHKASQLADEGMSLADIQAFLGHENAVTTAIYLHSLGVKK